MSLRRAAPGDGRFWRMRGYQKPTEPSLTPSSANSTIATATAWVMVLFLCDSSSCLLSGQSAQAGYSRQ